MSSETKTSAVRILVKAIAIADHVLAHFAAPRPPQRFGKAAGIHGKSWEVLRRAEDQKGRRIGARVPDRRGRAQRRRVATEGLLHGDSLILGDAPSRM